MSKIQNRYASAVHSSNLGSDPKTTMSDSDALGAYGLAARALTAGRTSDGTPIRPAPLAVPLERLFAGDNGATHEIVRQLAEMAFEQSFRMRVKIARVQAREMAQACLAWHRDGTCKTCGGRRWVLIPGTVSLSTNECLDCRGTGKIPFERQFRPEWRALAGWLVDEMTRAAGRAGVEASKALA